MLRRIRWALGGMAAGFLAAVWVLAGIRRARTLSRPSAVAGAVQHRVGGARASVRRAIAEGRRAMREYERQAQAQAQQRWATGGAGRGLAGGRASRLP